MWGDGKQTRSFCHVDDCVEGILRLTKSDYDKPLNLGSDVMVSMNEMMKLIMTFENKNLKIEHIPGPEGVLGRNSDNTLIKKVLGWAPSISLEDGLKNTYNWIGRKIEAERAQGIHNVYGSSKIVVQDTKSLDDLGAAKEASN